MQRRTPWAHRRRARDPHLLEEHVLVDAWVVFEETQLGQQLHRFADGVEVSSPGLRYEPNDCPRLLPLRHAATPCGQHAMVEAATQACEPHSSTQHLEHARAHKGKGKDEKLWFACTNFLRPATASSLALTRGRSQITGLQY